MAGYELAEWLEPGTMRRVLADGTVEVHKVGPGTDVPGPTVTSPTLHGRVALVMLQERREPPAW